MRPFPFGGVHLDLDAFERERVENGVEVCVVAPGGPTETVTRSCSRLRTVSAAQTSPADTSSALAPAPARPKVTWICGNRVSRPRGLPPGLVHSDEPASESRPPGERSTSDSTISSSWVRYGTGVRKQSSSLHREFAVQEPRARRPRLLHHLFSCRPSLCPRVFRLGSPHGHGFAKGPRALFRAAMNPPPKSVNSSGPQAATGLPPKAFFCRGWFAPIVHWQR